MSRRIRCPKCEQTVDMLTISRPHWCYPCKREYNNNYYHKTGDARRAQKRVNQKRTRDDRRAFIKEYLESHPCVICKEPDHIVLEFDHLDPKEKKYNVSEMVGGNCSIENIKTEISKCRVLCANCHRRETAKQQGWL
jgi:hypothetical protein